MKPDEPHNHCHYVPNIIQHELHRLIRGELLEGKEVSYYGAFEIDNRFKGGKIRGADSIHGAGTKILVAQLAGKFEEIGIDVVAINVNDVICSGAPPLTFSNYIAVHERVSPSVIRAVARGIRKGCNMAGVIPLSGSIPVMSDTLKVNVSEDKTFDIVGCAIGLTDRMLINGRTIKESDVVVGLESNGLHAHGFTLARPVLLKDFNNDGKPCANYNLDSKFDGSSIGEIMLRPAKIYVREVLHSLGYGGKVRLDIHGLAHIAGRGLRRLVRLSKFARSGIVLDNLPNPPAIMKEIQKIRNVSIEEMYSTFNMGIGFCIVLPKEHVDTLINICRRYNTEAFQIGYITKKYGDQVVILPDSSTKIKFDY